jgi:sodium/potassium/calcium exchanger 6
MVKCTFKDMILTHHSIDYLCKTGVKICGERQDMFNFFELYWCGFRGSNVALLLFYVLAIFLIFKYTAIAVDEYIAEGITKLSDYLGFSEALAAVTLLAFANGAGDVITALVASGTEGGISYNIGALFGAGVFVCTVVVALCIYQSEEDIVFDKMIIYRDIGIYLIATIATVAFALYGKITWWNSSLLLLLYVALVMVVIIEERMDPQSKDQDNEDNDKLIEMADDELKKDDEGENGSPSKAKLKFASIISSDKFQSLTNNGKGPKKKHTESMSKFLALVRTVKYNNFVKNKLALKHKARETPFEEKSYFDEFLEICDYPFLFILYLTALPTQEEHYSKLRCMVYAIPGMIFAWYIFHPVLDFTYVTVALPAGIALFFFFAAVLPNDNTPPRWFLVIAVGGVIAGLMWSYILIGALIDMLNLLGIVENLDETFLGLTILAIGNALPDALTTISLVKSGAGTMAISGGYAGQLFGYLVGFGISMLKITLAKGP